MDNHIKIKVGDYVSVGGPMEYTKEDLRRDVSALVVWELIWIAFGFGRPIPHHPYVSVRQGIREWFYVLG